MEKNTLTEAFLKSGGKLPEKQKSINDSSDSEEDVKQDPISFKERNAMLDIINEKRANFKFKTF